MDTQFFQENGNRTKFSVYKDRLEKLTIDFNMTLLTLCGEHIVGELENKLGCPELSAFGPFFKDNITSIEIMVNDVNKAMLTILDNSIAYMLDFSFWERIKNKRKKLGFDYKYIVGVANFDDYFHITLHKKLFVHKKSEPLRELWTSYFPVCQFSLYYLNYNEDFSSLEEVIFKNLDKQLHRD